MALNQVLDRTLSTLRKGAREATRAGRGAANAGVGLGKKIANRNPEPKAGMDDVTLTRKVETEIFRDVNSPKGKVDVNAVDGVVWLRGEVKNQAQIKSLEGKVRAIPEVKDVENLLHPPKTPAPTRAKAKPTSKREKKTQPRRFDRSTKTAEQKPAKAEPGPADLAAKGAGRQPAPLGAKDTATTPTTTPASTPESTTGGITPAEPTGGDGES